MRNKSPDASGRAGGIKDAREVREVGEITPLYITLETNPTLT
jgi:hypothetical protein